MRLQETSFDDIKEDTLRDLIGVKENKTLEFKRELKLSTDGEKKKLLKEVSALANASGGYIVFGLEDKNGEASDLQGVRPSDDIDDTVLQLEHTVQRNLDPRIPGLRSKGVELSDGTAAVVVMVPDSFAGPHRIKKGSPKFYSRNSKGVYPLNTQEIRVAFDAADSKISRIEEFRAERLGKVVAGDTPVPLKDGPKIVLHAVPLNAFQPGTAYDARRMKSEMDDKALVGSATTGRHNFDGYVRNVFISQEKWTVRYVQLFRNGSLEFTDAMWLSGGLTGAEGKEALFAPQIEGAAYKWCRTIAELYKALDVPAPFFLILSLMGVRGFTLPSDSRWGRRHPSASVDKSDLLLPEALVQNRNLQEAYRLLKPAFDVMWNSVGFPGSPTFENHLD